MLRILKLDVFESIASGLLFWWFKPIAFHLILHIQRFLGTFMVSYWGRNFRSRRYQRRKHGGRFQESKVPSARRVLEMLDEVQNSSECTDTSQHLGKIIQSVEKFKMKAKWLKKLLLSVQYNTSFTWANLFAFIFTDFHRVLFCFYSFYFRENRVMKQT